METIKAPHNARLTSIGKMTKEYENTLEKITHASPQSFLPCSAQMEGKKVHYAVNINIECVERTYLAYFLGSGRNAFSKLQQQMKKPSDRISAKSNFSASETATQIWKNWLRRL